MLNLAEIKAYCEAATKGPWSTVDQIWLTKGQNTYIISGSQDPHVGKPVFDLLDDDDERWHEVEANCHFASRARTDLPLAIAEIERLTKALEFYAETIWGFSDEDDPVARDFEKDFDDSKYDYNFKDYGKVARQALGGEGA